MSDPIPFDPDWELIDDSTPAPQPLDLNDVTRHMRHARRINNEIHDVTAMFDAELSRIRDAKEERIATLRKKLEWHKAPIRSFHEMAMTEDVNNRTLHTPYGRSKISLPSKPLAFIDDPDALTKWATKHAPDVVQRKVLVTDLRKHVNLNESGEVVMVDRATGEIVPVPGVHAEVPAPRWSLDLDPGSPL